MAGAKHQQEQSDQWFLRIGGESVFGPVTREGLLLWAEQGRVLPSHEVSSDRKSWIAAAAVDFLEMNWYVDDGQGDLRGPLNRKAAEFLLSSGKVPEGSQIISADEIEAGDRPEENAAWIQERDSLLQQLKRAASEQEALTKKAEKERRALEKRLDEACQQVKALESRLEEHARQPPERVEIPVEDTARIEELMQKLVDKDAEIGNLREKIEQDALQNNLRLSEARKSAVQERDRISAELMTVKTAAIDERESLLARIEEERQKAAQLRETLEAQIETIRTEERDKGKAALEALGQEARSAAEAAASKLAAAQAETETLRADLSARLEEAVRAREETEAKLKGLELEFTELLNASNANEEAYKGRITELEKLSNQSPEEIGRFYEIRTAVYNLVKQEIDTLEQNLADERSYFEQLKTASQQRIAKMTEERQNLLRHVGSGPEEMARQTLRQQPSESQNARLRAELENQKVTFQRELEMHERQEQDLQRRMQLLESENAHLREEAGESERLRMRLSDAKDLLEQRQRELADERRRHDDDTKLFNESKQALLARIERLENPGAEPPPANPQPSGKGPVFPVWMRLK
ncbi:MAG: hypothetical protein J6334_13770 [Kiritimatiellae bacterium]|nr:hypothetical protein [Kiritimatiellia bacterium]